VASGLTTGKADLLFASIPYKVLPSMQKQVFDKIRERDADFYRRLEEAGFLLDFGDDDSGLFMKIPAARVRLLHRRGRLRADRRRQDPPQERRRRQGDPRTPSCSPMAVNCRPT
jgi:hypothetical protein